MRRSFLLMGVLGVLAAGVGCRHIGGKCDCGYHPGDAIMTPPTPPYAAAPAPGTRVAPAIPPATTGTPDKLPLTTPKTGE